MSNSIDMISVSKFCETHRIETSFVRAVCESGLIQLTTIEQTDYISHAEVKELESIVHLYNDMDVNLEGVEVINRLLKRINSMHEEIIRLKNRLDFYEN